MSNRLRRYSLYAPYGPQADEAGAWVEAEEAKARIRELESALSGAQAEIAALTQPETGQPDCPTCRINPDTGQPRQSELARYHESGQEQERRRIVALIEGKHNEQVGPNHPWNRALKVAIIAIQEDTDAD